jgi:mannose-6-phosphate isomerase-like protein (cupin superfamily)
MGGDYSGLCRPVRFLGAANVHRCQAHLQDNERVGVRNAEGGPGNRHRGADQWLFVVAGTGVAKIKGQRYPLRSGTLLLIEHGDQHEIRNTGRSLLKTLNVYSPPAYTKSGEELPRARP